MDASATIRSPLLFSGIAGTFDFPKKLAAIHLRWPIVLLCAYLLVYSDTESFTLLAINSFVLIYLLSNAALYFIDEDFFNSNYFYTALAAFDTLFLTACLLITGRMGTDFYLAYFLIVIMAGVCQDIRGSLLAALLAPVAYGSTLFQSAETYSANTYVRLPFMLVILLFYGYFTQLLRIDTRGRANSAPP